MATKRLANEYMEKKLEHEAWKELSENLDWTEQMLEKYKDKVNWEYISGNRNIEWTSDMLEKFKELIDWMELSDTSCTTILTESCLEQFKGYWDWSKLSGNESLKLNYQLIDKFADMWDWTALINRWKEKIYGFDFLERYARKISQSRLEGSDLWHTLVEERIKDMKKDILG